MLGPRAGRCARADRARWNSCLKGELMASRLFRTFATLLALVGMGLRAATQQGTIAKVKERGKLLAGVKLDTPPFGFLDDKNEPAGFDIDIVRKIAARIGVPVELVKVTSATRIPLLVS